MTDSEIDKEIERLELAIIAAKSKVWRLEQQLVKLTENK